MHRQAERFGARLIADQLTEIDLSVYPYRGIGERRVSGAEHSDRDWSAGSVVESRERSVTSEGMGFRLAPPVMDFFFRNKRVAVIGGGNTACEEALFLTKIRF